MKLCETKTSCKPPEPYRSSVLGASKHPNSFAACRNQNTHRRAALTFHLHPSKNQNITIYSETNWRYYTLHIKAYFIFVSS